MTRQEQLRRLDARLKAFHREDWLLFDVFCAGIGLILAGGFLALVKIILMVKGL